MAVENHIGLLAAEVVELMTTVDPPLLREVKYQGLLALELNYLDPCYEGHEEDAACASIDYLRSLLSARELVSS